MIDTAQGLYRFLSQITVPRGGPLAIVFCETDRDVARSVDWDLRLGAAHVIAIGDGAGAAPVTENVSRFETPLQGRAEAAAALTKFCQRFPDRWILHHFNGEFCLFPNCETRTLGDLAEFMEGERRKSVMSYVIDLYSDDMAAGAEPDHDKLWFDSVGYYSRTEEHEDDTPPCTRIHGGLAWRFNEMTPEAHPRIDRIGFFKSGRGLAVAPDFSLNDPEMNAIACDWHHNATMAVMSLRMARSLALNPESARRIQRFQWAKSRRFGWTSQELMEGGFIEPGQWF